MNFFDFIPNAQAQSSDTTAQPTFGPIVVDPGGGQSTAVVNVTVNNTSPKEGETFQATVFVSSGSQSLSEMTLVINFDTTYLTVVDQDSSVEGTQVKILDEVFEIENTVQDNNLNSQRNVQVRLVAPDNGAFEVNGDMIQISFQARRVGNTAIEIKEGVQGRRLSTSRSDISFTGNRISLEIATQSGSNGNNGNENPGTNNPGTNNPGTNNPGTGNQNNNNQQPGPIPNTALDVNVSIFGTLGIGVMLVLFGLLLKMNSKRGKVSKR